MKSKNHEVQNAQPDDWMMALISVQTMDCASGNGRKGASRIRDSSSSSRPAMSITPKEGGVGARVMRDILRWRSTCPGSGRTIPGTRNRAGWESCGPSPGMERKKTKSPRKTCTPSTSICPAG